MTRGVLFLISFFFTSLVFAVEENSLQLFQRIFSTWTKAFNHKDLAGSCNLFSTNLEAHYQGAPVKNYQSICNGFKKVFQGKKDYQYRFKLHQVYRSHNWASVRITWYLTISEHGKVISETVDEGLDVFERDSQGHWKIVNYLAYPKSLITANVVTQENKFLGLHAL
jgi:ketosteroid isomerase-like protein